ncbi:MAG: hypothetical protein KKD77_23230 [Gammaproteobacteria bacterium]|nr:hypothetical protein [Gammaproteobacteria bacterium]
MAATVVWCNKCKTAVWAYDQMREGQDVRGLMNMMAMPCPECGAVGNFDGWSGIDETVEYLKEQFPMDVYDNWSALKKVLAMNCKDGKWAISPDCRWFHRPEDEAESDEYPSDPTADISDLIRERYRNNEIEEQLQRPK